MVLLPSRLPARTPGVCASRRLRNACRESSSSFPGGSGLRTPATSTRGVAGRVACSLSPSALSSSLFPLLVMST
eukprot:3059849-Pleurochrysis_carterae.AAC.1